MVIAARKADGLADAREPSCCASRASGDVHTVVANAGEPEQAQRCVDETMDRFGRVDILVNNAATNPYHGDLLDLDLPRAEKTVRVNQYGMIAWTRCAWQAWMAEHGGAVVNIASVGGLIVDPHIGYYNATKAAMIHMTRQLAYELGPQGTGQRHRPRPDQDRAGPRGVGGARADPDREAAAAPAGHAGGRGERGACSWPRTPRPGSPARPWSLDGGAPPCRSGSSARDRPSCSRCEGRTAVVTGASSGLGARFADGPRRGRRHRVRRRPARRTG